MLSVLRLIGQAVFYAAVCGFIGYFANSPPLETIDPNAAQVKLSLTHSANRKEECRRLTPEEIAKLPPSERRPNTCGRERVPMHVRLEIDGKQYYDATVDPLGLSKDGPARIYQKFVVPAGRHTIVAKLDDRAPGKGDRDEFNYVTESTVELKPAQNLAIDFRADEGGFLFY